MLGFFVGQIGAKELPKCLSGVSAGVFIRGFSQSVYPGFQPKCLSPKERYYCQDFSLLGEPDLAPRLYYETA